MSVAVEVLPEARLDMISGREFFEQCRAGLGVEFVAEVFATFDQIADWPGCGLRSAPESGQKESASFSYVVYYRLAGEGVEVIAVLYGGRDPRSGRDGREQHLLIQYRTRGKSPLGSGECRSSC